MSKENKLKFSDDDMRLVQSILDNYHPDHHTIKHIMFEANIGHLQKHVFKHPSLVERGFKHILNAEQIVPSANSREESYDPRKKYYTDGSYVFTISDHPFTKEREIIIHEAMYKCPSFIKPIYVNIMAVGISRGQYDTAVRLYKLRLEQQTRAKKSNFKPYDIPSSFADIRNPSTRRSTTVHSKPVVVEEMQAKAEKRIKEFEEETLKAYQAAKAKMNGPSESILSPDEPGIGGESNRISNWETYTFDLVEAQVNKD